MERKTIQVQNLKCGGCANTIINNLNKIKGVSEVTVNTNDDSVSFSLINSDLINQVKEILKTIGYPTFDNENNIVLKAKSFISCAKGRINNDK